MAPPLIHFQSSLSLVSSLASCLMSNSDFAAVRQTFGGIGASSWKQPPIGLQESAVQASLSLQLGGFVPVQVPELLHWSVCVQKLLSLHGVVLGSKASAGQAPLLHSSATSHCPASGRHTVLGGALLA